MPDETLTVSEPMTIAQIDAKYPDHCIYIVDPSVDSETHQVSGGRVAFASKSKKKMYDFIVATKGTWRHTATHYTRQMDPNVEIITRLMV